jgi:hypothetical protein
VKLEVRETENEYQNVYIVTLEKECELLLRSQAIFINEQNVIVSISIHIRLSLYYL